MPVIFIPGLHIVHHSCDYAPRREEDVYVPCSRRVLLVGTSSRTSKSDFKVSELLGPDVDNNSAVENN